MRTFADSAGRTWTVNLTVDAVRRVESARRLDLCQLHAGEPPLLLRLEQDAVLLFGVVWELIRPQADGLGVKEDQFYASIDAASIGRAADAFWSELADFFQSWRPRLARLVQETHSPGQPPPAEAPEAPQATEPSGEASTSLPPSPAATPAPTA